MNCDHILFCVSGIFLAFAYEDLSFNKVATQSRTYLGTGNGAFKAVDGNAGTCMRTMIIGSGSGFPDKAVWWKVDLGGAYNIYRIHIQFKNYDGYVDRQRGRFAGFSLYVSNSDVASFADIKNSKLCYKDGPQLPPLNFTTICTENSRYVLYYNERLKGIVYPRGYEVDNVNTEICEVIVQGCKNASFYGDNCSYPCPTNCKDNTCHIERGTCIKCKPGWTGIYCDAKCGEGWYGVNCSQQCSGYCRDGVTCNHVIGQCDKGCDAGWTEDMCNKECDGGSFGYNCVNKCSGHCLNDSSCNKQTGHCDSGCNPGYINDNCSKKCSPERFGRDCGKRCSGHCISNDACDHVSGVCPGGCQDGFVGKHCTNACKEGYFGTNCSKICSINCKPDTCRHTDGSCISCASGWTGDNCTTACVQSYGEHCRHPCSPHCYNETCDRFSGRCFFGCKDGFYGGLCHRVLTEVGLKIQKSSCSIIPTIGLSVSVLINLIVIVCGISLCRRNKSNKMDVFGNLVPCWKRTIYQDKVVKTEEASTYQELDLSDSTYENTIIR